MNKNTILKGISIVAILLMIFGTATAYDASTPYTVTMNLIVPSDTSFTVALAGAEVSIDFNPANANSVGVQPDSQNNDTSTPIAVITNAGNVNQNYSVNLTAAKPAWVVLRANSNTGFTNSSTYDTDKLELAGWNNTAAAGTVNVYLWANFTAAPGGTTSRTFQINSKAS